MADGAPVDNVAGGLLQKSLEARGLKFVMGGQTQALIGDADGGKGGRVMALQFKDGTEIPTDLVVMAVGIRPNTELAEKMHLHCNKGIVVNDTMQTTTDARIYSVGECAAHRGIAYGLVAPLFEQAKVAANHLAQFGIGRYTGSLTSTKLKVTGIDLFSAGEFQGGEGTEEIVMSDPFGGVYKKLVLKDDKLVGACLYGDTVDGSYYFKLLRDGRNVGDIRDKLMFGEAAINNNIGDTGHEGHTKAATMPDDAEVCGCNGVCKGTIVKAIREKGLFTVDEVRKHTKASGGCGSCTGLVEQILMFTAGGDYSAAPKLKAMCGCTDHGHQAVRDAIVNNKLLTIASVQQFMEWRTPNGCASCRPALNYYLISQLAQRGQRRSAKPLHQRTQPRQHPKRRHLQRHPAHVGRRDHRQRVAPHRRRGRQIQNPYCQSHRWPAHRPAGRKKGRLGQRVERHRHAQRPRLRQSPAHGEDLRGQRMVPHGHARQHANGQRPGARHVAHVRPAQSEVCVSAAARATAPRQASKTSASSAWTAAGRCMWRATAASRPKWRTSLPSSKPPQKCWSTPVHFASCTARKAGTWSAPCTTSSRVGLDYVKKRILEDHEGRKALWERLQFALDGEPDPWFEFDKAAVDTRQFEAIPV